MAAATDSTVLIAGKSAFRGLDPVDGSEKWKRNFRLVTGRGIRTGNQFLVPLADGSVETIDLDTGNQIGLARRVSADDEQSLPAQWSPGNLMAAGESIVSLRPDRVDVFPQTRALLKRTKHNVALNGHSFADDFLVAELQLALGNHALARSDLLAIDKRLKDPSHQLKTHALLREIIYTELEAKTGNELQLLNDLEQYSRLPEDRARFLLYRTDYELREKNYEQLFALTDELRRLDRGQPLLFEKSSQHQLTINAWLAGVFDKLYRTVTPTLRADINRRLEQELVAARDAKALDVFAQIYRMWPLAVQARAELAQEALDNDDRRRAELYLMANSKTGSTASRMDAVSKRIELLARSDLESEAILLLSRTRKKFGSDFSSDEAQRLLSVISSTGYGRTALQRTQPVTSPSAVDIVDAPGSITEFGKHALYELAADDDFDMNSRRLSILGAYRTTLEQPWGREYRMFAPSRQQDSITVLNRTTGVRVAKIAVPQPRNVPSPNRGAHVGHFLPIGHQGGAQAVSTLDVTADPLWKVSVDGLKIPSAAKQSIFRVGPAQASFCSFQTNDSLTVLNPHNGKLIWSRSDLPPRCGLTTDPYAGLFGDDQVLVLLAADQRNYTVYRTQTGEILQKGKLDIAPTLGRFTFGRFLFHVTDTGAERRFRIWDPLNDEIVFDHPAFEPRPRTFFAEKLPSGELALVMQPGRVAIMNVEQAKTIVSVPVRNVKWADVTSMQGFLDHDNFYIGFNYRSPAYSRARLMVSHARPSQITTNSFQGNMLAINRKTHKTWQRDIGRRSFVDLPFDRLPFLVSISYQQDMATRRLDTISIEVQDKNTGQVVARRENLPSLSTEEFVRAVYLPDEKRLELHTLRKKILINFDNPPLREFEGVY